MSRFRWHGWLMWSWQCYYCDGGIVFELPAKCPKCGEQLRKPANQLSDSERTEAWWKKNGPNAMFFLAS